MPASVLIVVHVAMSSSLLALPLRPRSRAATSLQGSTATQSSPPPRLRRLLLVSLGASITECAVAAGDPSCWGYGALTYERCCFPNPLDNPCWDSFHTPERCCGKGDGSAVASTQGVIRDSPIHTYGALQVLREELFTDVDPYRFLDHPCARPYKPQSRNPDSHLTSEIIKVVLQWIGYAPPVWLEVGSFVGDSAITTARTLKELSVSTGVICIDPFTGMLDMWNNRKGLRTHLGLRERPVTSSVADGALLMDEFGHSRIYEMFLANVRGAGHQDIVMPIRVSSVSGMRILKDLHQDGRIRDLPSVIYLDSAHEPNETLLEVREAWRILERPGVLFGDDWSWPGVRQDVAIFASELGQRSLSPQELSHFDWERTAATQPVPGLVVVDQDDGVWYLLKES